MSKISCFIFDHRLLIVFILTSQSAKTHLRVGFLVEKKDASSRILVARTLRDFLTLLYSQRTSNN